MSMSYTSLVADKSTTGSIASWVDYSKLQPTVILDEAQTLLFSVLRCREMLTVYPFTMTQGSSYIALPSRFLDPIGRIYQPSFNLTVRHKDQSFVERNRNYTETSGTLGTNPFTTVASSNTVTVNLTGHGFSQESLFYTTGASAFNGATISGTFPITSVVDANNFTIDISILGTTPSGSGAGGGASVSYTCDNLVQGTPVWWGVWDEAIHFDCAFTQTVLCKLSYFQSLPLLSSSNLTNFLTNRYPHLLRRACQAAAADFMKDDVEYQKHRSALLAEVQQVSIENDMMMRGMELDTETP